jgi:NAD(P)-dependent dehydrogenase (short-subunit alcohol dehydrogenase family)
VCTAQPKLRSFARTWTTDLKHRIRVNAISSGFIDTPGLREPPTCAETDQQTNAMVKNMVPLGTWEHQTRLRRLSYQRQQLRHGSGMFADGGSRRCQCLLDGTRNGAGGEVTA